MCIEFFTNDRYKVLNCMKQRQIEVAGSLYVPLSQRQISDITGVAYKTVSNIIRELKENEYITYQGTTRGKYSLTEKAKATLTILQRKGAKK